MIDMHYLGLVEIGRRIRERQISSVEVTRALLDRIASLDPALRSYARVTPELALAAAAQADREIEAGTHRGPLHGVPLAVKDLFHTQGVVTAAGTAIHKDFVPQADATVVARLKAAGAVLLGKLQMTEGAFSGHHPSIPPPRNPWNAAHWPGVSSSGSGVATAAGLCFGSLGTDTLGSIRFPSTVNGLTGLKPTWGRVSRAGVFALAESLDHVGPMARSAVDAAAILAAIAGPDPADPTALQEPVPDYLSGIDGGVTGVRIGIDRKLVAALVDADTLHTVEGACEAFRRLGATLVDIEFPPVDEALKDAVAICGAEAAAAHAATFPARAGEYGPELTGLLELGRGVDGVTLAGMWQRRLAFSGRMTALFQDVDLLLVPAMIMAAPTMEFLAERAKNPAARGERMRFTAPFTMSGHPCLALPGGETAQGMPVGFQLVGPKLGEAALLRAGHAFQQVTEWHSRRPAAGFPT